MYKTFLFFLLFLPLVPLSGATQWTSAHPFFEKNRDTQVYSLTVNSEGETALGWINRATNQIQFSGFNFIDNTTYSLPYPSLTCSNEVSLVKVALDDQHQLFTLWLDEGLGLMQVTLFQEGKWGHFLTVPMEGAIRNPVLQCDQLGNAFLIWEQFDGYVFQLKMTSFSAEKERWSSVFSLSTVGYECRSSNVAMDQEGNAVIFWCAHSHIEQNELDGIRAIRIKRGAFEPTEIFSHFETHYLLHTPQVEFDRDQNIYFVWEKEERQTGVTMIQSCLVLDKERQYIRDISQPGATSPSIVRVMDNMYVFWRFGSGLQSRDLQNHLSSTSTIPVPLTGMRSYLTDTDASGKLRLILYNRDQIQIATLDERWHYFNLDSYAVNGVEIGSDFLGNTLLTWCEKERLFYSLGDYLLPPSNFHVRKVKKRFPAKTVVLAQLRWVASKSPSVIGYRIRCNGEVLCDVSTTEFVDRKCGKGVLLYSISSLNARGLESRCTQFVLNNNQ